MTRRSTHSSRRIALIIWAAHAGPFRSLRACAELSPGAEGGGGLSWPTVSIEHPPNGSLVLNPIAVKVDVDLAGLAFLRDEEEEEKGKGKDKEEGVHVGGGGGGGDRHGPDVDVPAALRRLALCLRLDHGAPACATLDTGALPMPSIDVLGSAEARLRPEGGYRGGPTHHTLEAWLSLDRTTTTEKAIAREVSTFTAWGLEARVLWRLPSQRTHHQSLRRSSTPSANPAANPAANRTSDGAGGGEKDEFRTLLQPAHGHRHPRRPFVELAVWPSPPLPISPGGGAAAWTVEFDASAPFDEWLYEAHTFVHRFLSPHASSASSGPLEPAAAAPADLGIRLFFASGARIVQLPFDRSGDTPGTKFCAVGEARSLGTCAAFALLEVALHHRLEVDRLDLRVEIDHRS